MRNATARPVGPVFDWFVQRLADRIQKTLGVVPLEPPRKSQPKKRSGPIEARPGEARRAIAIIRRAMKKHDGNPERAAKAVGVSAERLRVLLRAIDRGEPITHSRGPHLSIGARA